MQNLPLTYKQKFRFGLAYGRAFLHENHKWPAIMAHSWEVRIWYIFCYGFVFIYLATRDASKPVNFRQPYLSVQTQSEVLNMASYLGCPNPLQNKEWVNLIERLPNELLLHILKMLLVDYDLNGDLHLKTTGFKILVETIRKISRRLYFTSFTY